MLYCGKRGHISPACPEPRKEEICAEQTQGTLEDMITKSVTAALDAREAAQKKEKDLKGKDGQDFPSIQQWKACPAQQIGSQFLKNVQ